MRPAPHGHWDEDQLSSLQFTPTSASCGPVVRSKGVILETADVKATAAAHAYAAMEGAICLDGLPADAAGGGLSKKILEVHIASPSALSTVRAEVKVFRFV